MERLGAAIELDWAAIAVGFDPEDLTSIWGSNIATQDHAFLHHHTTTTTSSQAYNSFLCLHCLAFTFKANSSTTWITASLIDNTFQSARQSRYRHQEDSTPQIFSVSFVHQTPFLLSVFHSLSLYLFFLSIISHGSCMFWQDAIFKTKSWLSSRVDTTKLASPWSPIC